VIVNDNQINSTIDDTIEENLLLAIPNHHEGNPTNKSFKRKAVSFSAMPYEKKVADGKEIFLLFLFVRGLKILFSIGLSSLYARR
jgi:hypothetical protein